MAYHKLPSEIVATATTFDLMVYDVWTTWEAHKKNPAGTQQYSQEDLQQIMAGAKRGG